jgi:hypothetical protein
MTKEQAEDLEKEGLKYIGQTLTIMLHDPWDGKTVRPVECRLKRIHLKWRGDHYSPKAVMEEIEDNDAQYPFDLEPVLSLFKAKPE